MTEESDRADRVRYLLRMSKSLLVRADAIVQGDTEYLREEINYLMENTEILLEKMNFEQGLRELRDELHGEHPPETLRSSDTGTGVRLRLPD